MAEAEVANKSVDSFIFVSFPSHTGPRDVWQDSSSLWAQRRGRGQMAARLTPLYILTPLSFG